VAERIAMTRAEARERNGWIMDSYLLRKDGMA
jgi:precorrin-6A synthase